MAQQVEATIKVFMKILLANGENFYFHNFPNRNPNQILTYQGKNWNYLPANLPLGSQKMGEDVQSTRITIPNIGASQHGAFPIRDWIENGTMDGCYFEVSILINDLPQRKVTYTLAEKEFRDEYGSNAAGSIVLTLRQPDDGLAQMLTYKITEALVGTAPSYLPN